MTCDGRREEILLYLTDGLEEIDRGNLEEHLQTGCPQCMAELSAAREVIGWIPLALSPQSPRSAVRRRLIERAGDHVDEIIGRRKPFASQQQTASPLSTSDQQAAVTTPQTIAQEAQSRSRPHRRISLSGFLSPAVTAVIVFLITYLVMTSELRDGRERIRGLESQFVELKDDLEHRGSELTAMKRFHEMLLDLSSVLASHDADLIPLQGKDDTPVFARVLVDAQRGFCYLFQSDSVEMDLDSRYALLFEKDENEQAVQAAEFRLSPIQPTRIEFQLPDTPSRFNRISIQRIDSEEESASRDEQRILFGFFPNMNHD